MLDTRLIPRRVFTVNKAQLIDKLSGPLGSKKAATDAVDGVLDHITRAVAAGERVALTGFGVFEKVAPSGSRWTQPAHRRRRKDQEDIGAEVQGRAELQGRRARRQEAAQGCDRHGPCSRRSGQEGGPAKKAAAKKVTAKKAAPAKRVVAKKVVAKRAAPAKKVAAKKAPAKKAHRQEDGEEGREALTANCRGPGDRVRSPGPRTSGGTSSSGAAGFSEGRGGWRP